MIYAGEKEVTENDMAHILTSAESKYETEVRKTLSQSSIHNEE